MKKSILILGLLPLFMATSQSSFGQQSEDFKYRRSSLYSILINHTEQQFGEEIKEAFLQMPIPDKFNDHDLSVKVLNLDEKLKNASSDKENVVVTDFLNKNQIASRLVARWFNRDYYTGVCNMELVKARGLYNSNEFDRAMSEKSVRSEALLMDAGEDLIGNTFVLVNDIRYVDKAKKSKAFGNVLRGLGSIAGAVTGLNIDDITDNLADMTESIKGFKVRINTFLYQLVWEENVSYPFYKDQYLSAEDPVKKQNFENARGNYKLVYVGKQESKGSTTSFLGIKEEQPILMVRKACQRALDENVADLQHNFEAFRTKSPLMSASPITAKVGLKEGLTSKSKFEVLEVIEQEDGTHKYKRVGIIEPIESLIWDNRYMAVEEGAENANLGFTTFRKVSGGEFFPGMLIKEIDK